MLNKNEQEVLALIQKDPFISQKEIAQALHIPRSTVASVISSLIAKKQLQGRAYVINAPTPTYVIGGMNIDRKFNLEGKLIPKTSNPVTSSTSIGGVGRNIAENLGRLDQAVTLLSVAGYDNAYDIIKEYTAPYVNLSQVTQLLHETTSSYSAVLDPHGEMLLALADMDICRHMTKEWINQHHSQLVQAESLVVDLNINLEAMQAIIDIARHHDINLVIVPVSAPKMTHLPDQLDGVNWIIVNRDESEAYFGYESSTHIKPTTLVQNWLKTGVKHVILTCGKDALYLGSHDTAEITKFTPPTASHIKDVTGAGDAFAAGLIYGILQNCSTEQSIHYALANAYLTIQSTDTVRNDLSSTLLDNTTTTLFGGD